MKKILALLIIPIVAMGIFFGCKKDSVSSLEDSKNLYIEMMDSYITTDAAGDPVNFIFKNNKHKYDESSENAAEAKEYVMYISFGDNSNGASNELKSLHGAVLTENKPSATTEGVAPTGGMTVAQKLYQYTDVYQALLSCIFEYYDTWQERFYSVLANEKNLAQDDIDGLYYATKDLKKEVENFHTQKQLFEEEVVAFGINSALIKGTIDTFNYQYNKLIKQSFTFIEKFIELQNKYFLADDTQAYYANMVSGQAAISMAKAIFYANIVSMETSEYCSIEHLAYTKADNTPWTANTFSDAISTVVNIESGVVSMKECEVAKSPEATDFTSKVRALQTTTRNFNQQFDLYMKAFSKFPIYEYKCMNFRLDAYSGEYNVAIKTSTEFREGLNFENKARENIIYQFEHVTLATFVSNITAFVGNN